MILAWLSLACAPTPEVLDSAAPAIPGLLELAWFPEEGGLDSAQARAGLAWDLSLLGALPPPDGAWLTVSGDPDADPLRWTLDLGEAGFPEAASEALVDALDPLQASDELAIFGYLDVGRLLMRTLHEPWRYYSITGACRDLEGEVAPALGRGAIDYAVTTSLLTSGERLVRLPEATPAAAIEIGFDVMSGTGSLAEGDFSPWEHETLRMMPNGQQRLAVYDLEGKILPAADPAQVPAGQPGKCQWCHEDHLMPGTTANEGAPGYLDPADWFSRLEQLQATVDEARAALLTEVDFEEHEVHTWGEKLVREHLLPQPTRVAREWGMSEAELLTLLEARGIETTSDPEWPQRGEVLLRGDLDRLLEAEPQILGLDSFSPLWIQEDARELDPATAQLDGEWWADLLETCAGG